MNALRNKVQLIGRVGADPVIRNFESGKRLAHFSMATSEVYYDNNNEKVEQTQWHHIVAWGNVIDVIEKFVNKGKEIAVEGKLTYRDYETKEGEKKYITEVVLSELLFLGNNKKVEK